MKLRRLVLNLIAPAAAIVFSVAVSSLLLWASGYNPAEAFNAMWEYGTRSESIVSIVNRAIPLFVAGLAVAIGFKMNLFNIGVEGQYRIAALVAAAFGAWISLPAPLHVAAIIVVAMLVGAAWASIPAVLKVTRGVHEVISSIMLNTIATGLGAYLLATYFKEERAGDLVPKTKVLPKSGQMPSLNPVLEKVGIDLPTGSSVRGFLLVAVLLGVAYYLLVWRTRFGYDLRAAGVNPTAAQASGVRMNGMTVRVMLMSGAIAGLIGIGDVLGFYHSYSIDFPTGLGFTGIGVALLGRNHPVGIAAGALLFAYLDRSAQILDARSIPREIVVIMQGIILLSVVIAYEVVRRIGQAQETKAAAEATQRMEEEQSSAPVEAVIP
jgi:simple sugar transport system permease protein